MLYCALDLEFEQPCGTIIEVGITIADPAWEADRWIRRNWLITPQQPLSDFIQGLTKITQPMMDAEGVTLQQCGTELSALLSSFGRDEMFVNPVVWGHGDMESLMAAFRDGGVDFPHFGRRWLDVKTLTTFVALAQGRPIRSGLRKAMGRWGLHFEGVPHRAEVDAFNTLRLFFKVLGRQTVVEHAAAQLIASKV